MDAAWIKGVFNYDNKFAYMCGSSGTAGIVMGRCSAIQIGNMKMHRIITAYIWWQGV